MADTQPVPETPQQKTARRTGACEGHMPGGPCDCLEFEQGRTIAGYVRCTCEHTQGVHRVTSNPKGEADVS